MEVKLNAYIKNVSDKWLRPILRDHGCEKLHPNLNNWKFQPVQNPKLEEWEKLTSHQTEDTDDNQDREILPINGRIRLCESVISLELLLKFVDLRLDISDWEIDSNKKTYEENNTPKMVLIEAARQPIQEAYYSSLQEIGQCNKTALTNRAKSLTLELGINLQDIRIPVSKKNTLRLIRNQ